MVRRKPPKPPTLNWFGYFVGFVVIAVFISASVIQFRGGQNVSWEINALMGGVVGVALGISVPRRK